MPKTDRVPKKPRASRTEAALDRLAEAQEATQAELRDLVVHVRHLTERLDSLVERVSALADAQRQTERTLQELTRRAGRVESDVDGLAGRELERHYREHAMSFFQRILSKISEVTRSDLEALAVQAEGSGTITVDEHQDLGLADVVVRGVARADGRDCYLVAEVSRSVSDRDVVRAQRRAAILARSTGLAALAAVSGERIRPEADSSARAAGVWRVLDGVTVSPAETVPPNYLVAHE